MSNEKDSTMSSTGRCSGAGCSSSDQSMTPKYGKHPPHLKGRAIGMFYANRSKKKQEKEQRNVVMINKRHEDRIHNLLKFVQENSEDSEFGASSSTTANNELSDVHLLDISGKRKKFSAEYVNHMEGRWQEENGIRNPLENMLPSIASLNVRLRQEKEARERNPEYVPLFEFRKKLPSYKMRKEIVEVINDNQVVIVSGETGCGKTTQIPQFILDDYIERGVGSECKVICTQPRRISAISVAQRVAEERLEHCGGDSTIGYQIRLENKLPRKQGSILYCTTGIVLQLLQSDPYLAEASHIVLDEIHERDLLADFLMIILKDLLTMRPQIRVILMSATLNAESFGKYFGKSKMVHIPGLTYPVKEYYLEDVLEMTRYFPNVSDRSGAKPVWSREGRQKKKEISEYQKMIEPFLNSISSNYSRQTIQALRLWNEEEIEYDLIVEILRNICSTSNFGAVLIFVPGLSQINALFNILSKHGQFGTGQFLIIPLHSLMPTVSQKEVFNRPPPGIRKIIIATNIAETSITIDDVVYVIDTGKIKISNYDVNSNIATLRPEWVALSNAHQRRGRAGRLQPGVCYHLYSRAREMMLQAQQLPEMLRTRVDSLCLKIKLLKLGKIEPFISKAMDPPQPAVLAHSIEFLKTLCALDTHENLTPLGFHLAKLPVEPQMGRMILLGSIFSCLDPILTVAACLSFKDPFYVPLGKQKEVDQIKKDHARDTQSDHLMFASVFHQWEDAEKRGYGSQFCWDNYLSHSNLKMLRDMKRQFAQYLEELHFLHCDNVKHADFNINSNNENLLRAIICAGLYPNVAKIWCRFNKNKQQYTKTPKFATQENARVLIHPKSVNYAEKWFPSNWMVYYEKLKTTRVFLYDTSVVSSYPLLFFGGRINATMDEGCEIVTVDNWITFQCPRKTASLVKKLRSELDKILERKIENPGVTNWDPSNPEGAILQAIVNLITCEEPLRANECDNMDLFVENESD